MSYAYVSTMNPVAAGSWCADPYTPGRSPPPRTPPTDKLCTHEERHQMIARGAYFRAQRRGFDPGHELDDWLLTEHEVNAACGLLEPHPNWDHSLKGE
jgi:hypothetical protein